MAFALNVLNRGKKKRARAKRQPKKKAGGKRSSRRRASTATASPPRKRRRRRKSVAAPKTMAKRRRRRTTRSSNPSRRRSGRRRRRNPGLLRGGFGKIAAMGKGLLPLGLGMLAAAALAKKVGDGSIGEGGPSSIGGEPWTWTQYAAAVGVGFLGSQFVGKIGLNGEKFFDGALGLALMKGVFTFIVPKSETLKKYIGADDELEYDPATGQMWMFENGKKVALQGLVTASPLDGLVTASPMDGDGDNFGEMEDSNDVLSAYA